MGGTTKVDYDAREAKPLQGGADLGIVDLFRLDGRTILITGGAGFLGMAVAAAIVESGGDVVLLDRLSEPPTEAWSNLQATAVFNQRQIRYQMCDITSEDLVAQAFAKFVPELRFPLRGLVACAGISEKGPSIEYGADAFRRVFETNVTGTFVTAKAVAREMQKANVNGSMVLVASMSGSVVNKGVDTAAYNSSKSAVLQLARSLAAEWGSRVYMPLIRVNTLSPGYIRTAATVDTLKQPGIEEQWTSDNMLNRLSTADEFRGPVVFLLSEASSFMTGADLRIDGGHCAW